MQPRRSCPIALITCLLLVATGAKSGRAEGTAIRIATFNIADVRSSDLTHGENPRVRRIAEVIQRMRPNILLLNEIAYDEPGIDQIPSDAAPGQNAQRFVDQYLSVPQAPGLKPLRYKTFMRRSNTGLPSGYDLDQSGDVVQDVPPTGESDQEGNPPRQTAEGRAFGGDSWGFGTFPGQYGMALLVDERLDILTEKARTFRLLPWSYMPNAMLPTQPGQNPEGEQQPWYPPDAIEVFRLSSKAHWDVPIRLPSGAVLRALCSHPTPPAFDGPEQRNKRRNHDEIRFWADYLADAAYIVDDSSTPGGIADNASFVILGDLNADLDEGSSIHNPIRLLLDAPRVHADRPPRSDIPIDGLDPDDTARFGLRVDYALFSDDLRPANSGVWRHTPDGGAFPSDHFPVWVDLVVPDPATP